MATKLAASIDGFEQILERLRLSRNCFEQEL